MTILFNFIYILLFPFFAISMMLNGKWHDGMSFRLGKITDDFRQKLSDAPKIWIHAVSAGEVLAVAEFVKRLSREYPQHQIICSTVTRAGFELASANLKDTALVIFAPIDFSWVVRRFVDMIQPKVYISAETELWPNLYRALHQRQIPIALINGRISDSSFHNYRLGKFLFQSALQAVDAFAMQTQEDADRIMALGADPSRVSVVGNLKFDTVSAAGADHAYEAWAQHRIVLAGSTHPGEEEIVLDAFVSLKKSFPDVRLMLAPRHIERAGAVIQLAASRGYSAVRLSECAEHWPEGSVIVVDQMGKLRHLYRIAAAVFIGKTFNIGGGQNMIEPLAFGCPTFVGPLTQNFKDVMTIFLKAGVIVRVERPEDLAQEILKIWNDPAAVEKIRAQAPQTIRQHQGATEKLVSIVKGLRKL